MIKNRLQAFSGKRVLLLQGPVGPFFTRLAEDLRAIGAQVFKVNFNAGDWFFYRKDAVNYRGTMEDWSAWFEAQLRRLRIDAVLLFGDCRPIHRAAHNVASALGLDIGVFEEGYVRPDYITFERFGVNGFSRLPRTPEAYDEGPKSEPARHPVGSTYWTMVWYGFLYFLVGWLGRGFFPNYVHHRPFTILEGLPWIRSAWRKYWYRWKERGMEQALTGRWSGRYFLVPLQVFNDAQVTIHASIGSIEHFIERVLRSFAAHAPGDTMLVFKHHPMDRGYRDYAPLIRKVALEINADRRVLYVHDQHLPHLLDHARGVVVVNSTVGLSALHHGAPTMVCGTALYHMPGLTYQGDFDKFWNSAPQHTPDRGLYQRFRNRLIAETQINGSLYRRVTEPCGTVGGRHDLQSQIPVQERSLPVGEEHTVSSRAH
jgi:capsular polysaccharide export protein